MYLNSVEKQSPNFWRAVCLREQIKCGRIAAIKMF